MDLDLIRSLAVPGTTKIVLLSSDGLGGFPDPATGQTELETARIPNLDALARRGACGLLRHVAPGITPGQRARPPRPLRLRSRSATRWAAASSKRSASTSTSGGGRGRAGQLLHASTRAGRITDRRAGRIATDGAPRWWSGCAGSACPASSSSSSRSRSTASSSCCAGRACPAASPRPTPRRSASRRCPCTPQAPEAQRTADARQPVRRRGPDACSPTRRPPTWCSCAASTSAPRSRASPRCTGCAPRRSPPIRCTAASPAWSAWTCSRPAARSPTRCTPSSDHWDAYDFFFLHYKDTDKAGRGRRLRRQGGGARALRRRAPGDPRARARRPRRHRRPRHPVRPRGPRLAAGARAPGRSVACPIPWSASPSGPARRAASGSCRPTT